MRFIVLQSRIFIVRLNVLPLKGKLRVGRAFVRDGGRLIEPLLKKGLSKLFQVIIEMILQKFHPLTRLMVVSLRLRFLSRLLTIAVIRLPVFRFIVLKKILFVMFVIANP